MNRFVRSFPIEGLALISTSRRSPPETHEFHLNWVVFKSDHQAGDGVGDNVSSLFLATTIEPSLLNHPRIEDLLRDPLSPETALEQVRPSPPSHNNNASYFV